MAIFRGTGGAGDATGGVTINEVTEQAVNAANSATEAATSASAAATSATAAATSATNSATSASQSDTSATNSANSATASATSATNSANSATASASSATASAASATDAASSATDAQTAQVAGETAQTASEAAQAAAATSASNASTSATSASTSASNAASSATASASSATTSASSATASASSATDSANSATSSANSATASSASASSAASSAAAAAASLDSFDDRYLGAKASAPTLDNDGNALVTGALYYDTTEGGMFVYDGAQWIAASSASQAILTVYKFTATSGQTTFTGVDDNAATLSYTAGSIIVTLNGIFLEGGDDYTATDGVNVVLSAGATTSDEVNIYAFNTFDVANVQAIGDDRYVRLTTDQTIAGTKTLSSNPVLSAGTANGVTYLNGSKVLTSGSALTFNGSDFGVSASIATATLASSGAYSVLSFTNSGGASTSGLVVVNASGIMQTRAATQQWTNLDASSEYMRLTSTGLGIGTSSPQSGATLTTDRAGFNQFFMRVGGVNRLSFYADAAIAAIDSQNTRMAFYTNAAERMVLDTSGNLGLGVTPSAWSIGAPVFQFNKGALFNNQINDTYLGANFYYGASADRYIADDFALQFGMENGSFVFRTAPSGTAGNAISFNQAMTLDANGKLLVGGTVSIGSQLVQSRSSNTTTVSNTYAWNGNDKGIILRNDSNTTNSAIGLTLFGGSNGNAAAGVYLIQESANSLGALALYTGGSGQGNTTPERVRIDSSGNVGIGTTSPATMLDVRGEVSVAYNATYGIRFYNQDRNNWSSIGCNVATGTASANLVFKDSTGEVARMTGGNVGIGTTAPAGKFEVSGGRSWFTANNEVYSLAMRYGAGTGVMYIGATNSATPSMQFSNGGGGALVNIDWNGNVGIGTSSPPTKLVAYQGAQQSPSTSGNMNTGFMFGTGAGSQMLNFGTDDTGVWYNAAYENNAGIVRSHRWLTGGVERVRIDNSGNLLVGTQSTGFTNSRSFTFQGVGDGQFYVNHSTANTNGDGFIGFGYNGGKIGSITQSGTTGVAYNTSSDYRLKEDWQPMTGASERVLALNPVNFAWKADGSRVDGFLAHEAAEVVPEAVSGAKDAVDADGNPDYQGIDQSKLVPLLTAALQEALAKIESLEARLDAANI